MAGRTLAEKVMATYGTYDAFALAERAGCTVVYARWHPVTLGEYHRRTRTIYLNQNAEGSLATVLAHELGHFFGDAHFGSIEADASEQIARDFCARIMEAATAESRPLTGESSE